MHRHVMNANAENFKDILILVGVIAEGPKICYNKWTQVAYYYQKCATEVHLLQHIFGYLAITERRIKISF